MRCDLIDLGIVDYTFADGIQADVLNDVKNGGRDSTLIITEFFPVYTIGRNGSLDNLLVTPEFLKDSGISYFKTVRGGDITFHGPGQLVVYPILNLAYFQKDINWFLRALEEVIIRLLLGYGIKAGRKTGLTGVWAGGGKIASIGISVSKWVTSHGISLNANNDLSFFDFINPCGIKNCPVASIAELNGSPVDMGGLKREFTEQFKIIFGVKECLYSGCRN